MAVSAGWRSLAVLVALSCSSLALHRRAGEIRVTREGRIEVSSGPPVEYRARGPNDEEPVPLPDAAAIRTWARSEASGLTSSELSWTEPFVEATGAAPCATVFAAFVALREAST